MPVRSPAALVRMSTSRRVSIPHPLVAALAGALALSGCAAPPDSFAPDCPRLALLPGAADLTQFDAHGQDLTDTELQARITGVPAVCGAGPHGTVKAQIQVDMDLSRGPAATGRDVGVPYFITIMRGGAVLEQKDYVATTQFPANLDSIKISDDPINMVFPVSAQVPSGAYVIYVGFRLTAAQLAYNRQHPPR